VIILTLAWTGFKLHDRHVQGLLAGSAVGEDSGCVGAFHTILVISSILSSPFEALEPQSDGG